MIKAIDYEKIFALGIKLDETERPVKIYVPPELSKMIKHELSYIFQDDITFVKDQSDINNSLVDEPSDSITIFSEADNFVANREFEKSVEVALTASDEHDTPIIKLYNNLIGLAISRGASDLHIDPSETKLSIRVRIDGVITTLAELDHRVAQMLIARIKLLGNLDITERRRPQDGRMTVRNRGTQIDVRIAALPVQDGERIVLRFFSSQIGQVDLNETSLLQCHKAEILRAVSKQSGLILVCGPTGSGKTTTIYSILNSLRRRGLNIMTIEDPIEIKLDHVVQSQVNEDVNFSFSEGLKSLLRNDPDVIVVGEIRDGETAQIAVRAAMTGHLVISTVHANSPLGAIKRLMNLGADKSLLADSLLGVFSQRLVRLYCKTCQSVSILNEAHSSSLPTHFDGCEQCYFTGFQGRQPVMSHLAVDEDIRHKIETGQTIPRVEDTMYHEAHALHLAGEIPFFEVLRVQNN